MVNTTSIQGHRLASYLDCLSSSEIRESATPAINKILRGKIFIVIERHIPRFKAALEKAGWADIMIVVGGVIPADGSFDGLIRVRAHNCTSVGQPVVPMETDSR